MKTRRLGRSELDLTVIGLGSWAIGGPWLFGWGPQDDAESIRTIHAALDAGINWIDTAAIYGHGHSEKIVGKAVKGRNDIIVATKCGLIWDDLKRVTGHLLADSIRLECEKSLKRLGVDTIDLYQVHWPNPDEQIEEGWGEMARLVEQGKIRYAGLSNFDASQMKRAEAIMPVVSLQPPYSMVRREIEAEILPYCKKLNMGVVPYSPMQNGLLTGKYSEEMISNLPDDDFRKSKNPQFQQPKLGANLDLVDALKPIAESLKLNLAQLAVAWVLRNDAITSAIVGMRKPEQVAAILPAADAELSDEVMSIIDSLIADRDKAAGECE